MGPFLLQDTNLVKIHILFNDKFVLFMKIYLTIKGNSRYPPSGRGTSAVLHFGGEIEKDWYVIIKFSSIQRSHGRYLSAMNILNRETVNKRF